MTTLADLKAQHPEWCFNCGYPSRPGECQSPPSPLIAALIAKAHEDEARIEELTRERDSETEELLHRVAELGEVVTALLHYVGPLDDPSIGWRGHGSSSPSLFRCEKCGQEDEDCTLIPHLDQCSAGKLLKMLATIKEWKEKP